ncbi:MAG TPA: peptidoglycan-binding domain-containing protein [Xanthobacteraceae bacterium]|nr:peptidoglycan-binding domain-containing protein [Xanthobacteraceae bacterium]
MDDDATLRRVLRNGLPRRPQDVVCLGLAVAAVTFILVNALFLQSGRHPAPIFTEVRQPAAPTTGSIPMPPPKPQASARLPAATLPAAPVKTAAAPRGNNPADPIAELLEPSNRTAAVQRALAEFGYGQIKPTGTLGPETRAAIEKFERERKLPVTGQISERLTRELSAMKGGPL